MTTKWTPEDKQQLTVLVKQKGLSAREAGQKLDRTRMAVIGQLYRIREEQKRRDDQRPSHRR